VAKTFLNKKNNAKSTITDNPLTSGATTLNVQTGDGAKFPAAPFNATLYSTDPASGEIVKITAKSTDQFTIVRAQEGTTAQEWAQGTKLELLVTAKLFDDFQTRTEIVVATDGSGDYNTDGTADQSEINEAISNLPASGGIVFLKKGTYTISAAISILKSNVVLEGEGAATIIKMANNANLDYMVAIGDGGITSYQNCAIRKIQFDANKANQTAGTGTGPIIYGASSYKNSRHIIENCWVHDSRSDAVRLLGAEDSIVKGCIIWNAGGSAIGVFTSSQYNTIHGNVCFSNGYGIYDNNGNYNTVSGNIFRNNGYGVYLTGAWRYTISGNVFFTQTNYDVYLIGAQRCTVTGNHFYGSNRAILIGNSSSITQYNAVVGNTIAWTTNPAISLYYGTGTTVRNLISGNAIYGSGTEGIYVYGSSQNVITDNVIDYASRNANNTYNSIFLTDTGSVYSTYNIVANNNCQASQANKALYHIRENGASNDYNLVIGNICKDAVTGQISLQGTNSVRGTNIPATG
jgi:parallel beta-helix repeat protein